MIHEIAVDPETFVSWGALWKWPNFKNALGLGQPRVLSTYVATNEWRQAVLARLRSRPDMEVTRLTALMVQLLQEGSVRRAVSDVPKGATWLEQVENECARAEYGCILAESNPRGHAKVLTSNTLMNNPDDPRWAYPRDATSNREPSAIGAVLEPMLRIASEIVFVDPYFKPTDQEARAALQGCFERISTRRSVGHPSRIEVVVAAEYERASTPAYFRKECSTRMPNFIPTGMVVRFTRMRQRKNGEKLHNRYLLTDVGGVRFGNSVRHGGAGETDDIGLMERNSYLNRWNQYAGSSLAFDIEPDPVDVVGVCSRPGLPAGTR